jgi:hypothetical protein
MELDDIIKESLCHRERRVGMTQWNKMRHL